MRIIKFIKNSKAATAIEFAIVFPILLLILICILEFGLTMFFDSSLNTGIRDVARQGIPTGYTSIDPINTIMNNNLGGLYDPSKATFTLQTFNNFTDIGGQFGATGVTAKFKADPNNFFLNSSFGGATFPPYPCSQPGFGLIPPNTCQQGEIAIYGVKYKWGGVTGLIPFIPKYLYSFAIVRNE